LAIEVRADFAALRFPGLADDVQFVMFAQFVAVHAGTTAGTISAKVARLQRSQIPAKAWGSRRCVRATRLAASVAAGTASKMGSSIIRRFSRAFHARLIVYSGADASKNPRARRNLRAVTRGVQLERDRKRGRMHFFLDFISEAPYI
jgi:hypothetical protein